MKSTAGAALLLLAVLPAGCGRAPAEARVQPAGTPAPPGSVFPSLAVDDERLLLSWIEPASDGVDPHVRFAARERGEWGATETISASPKLFVNWADFPSLVVDDDGVVGAQWLVRGGGPIWAYGVRFATRRNGGEWGVPSIPHRMERAAEHGFVSLLSANPGEFEIVWLDGREMDLLGTMELRYTVWTRGRYGPERILDDDACTCCQTDAAAFESERFVAYRDHAEGEIRDISYVRFDGERWSAPQTLSDDGWEIGGCPVNGPAVAARERLLAVAWFTQADDEPRVWVKRSVDFGASFEDPVRIDGGDPIGRVDAAMLDDSSTVVVWLERVDGEAQVSLRRLEGARAGPVVALGRTAAHRESGFPRLATNGSSVWVAWTETSRPTRLRLVRVDW